jgi:hypothetical protein
MLIGCCMKYTFKSRKLGKIITFSRPGKHYIFIDLNGNPGTLGQQICDNGYLLGNTVMYNGNDDERFEILCKKWWKSYLNNFPRS